MPITASELRARIYRLLDQVIESGVPLEVRRKGRVLRIVPADQPPKFARLVRRKRAIRGDPDDLVHMDWSGEWKP